MRSAGLYWSIISLEGLRRVDEDATIERDSMRNSVLEGSGLFSFNLPAIFQCAVELGAAFAEEAIAHRRQECDPAEELRQCLDREKVDSSRRCETALQRLMRVLNPRDAHFPIETDYELFLAKRRIGEAWSGEEPRPGWKQEIDLADVTAGGREALMTLGLALADVRGDRQWHERGWELLSAGTWNLWDAMGSNDREAVRELLAETNRLWGWPAASDHEPKPFTGQKATLADPRVLTPDWRTGTTADLDTLNEDLRFRRAHQLARAATMYSTLSLQAPAGTAPSLAEAYDGTAKALVQVWYTKLHVLPVAGADEQLSSLLTRERILLLPWGECATEVAAREAVSTYRQAMEAYTRAELSLRCAVDTGHRCNFADALGWMGEVVRVLEGALSGERLWDQAAAAMSMIIPVDLPRMLEEMRREVSRATVHFLAEAAVASPERIGQDASAEMGPALDKDEVAILTALASAAPQLCWTYDLEGAISLSRKTIGEKLSRLIDLGLADRPMGARKGAVITSQGRAILAQVTR